MKGEKAACRRHSVTVVFLLREKYLMVSQLCGVKMMQSFPQGLCFAVNGAKTERNSRDSRKSGCCSSEIPNKILKRLCLHSQRPLLNNGGKAAGFAVLKSGVLCYQPDKLSKVLLLLFKSNVKKGQVY